MNGNSPKGALLRSRILDAIEVYVEEHGYPPTASEIGAQLERSKSTINEHLGILEREGRITRGEGTRALTINRAHHEH